MPLRPPAALYKPALPAFWWLAMSSYNCEMREWCVLYTESFRLPSFAGLNEQVRATAVRRVGYLLVRSVRSLHRVVGTAALSYGPSDARAQVVDW